MRLFLTWMRLGRPARGPIERRARNSYPFEEGVELPRRLEAAFGDLSTLSAFDLGAGPGESAIATQILQVPWRRLVSVEAFLPYLHRLQTKHAKAQQHDVEPGRIETIFDDFPPREIDLALLIDVIEHYSKPDALALLRRLESFVRVGVAVFAPLGKVKQEPYDQNALQRHLSSWRAEDFSRLGYAVTVYEGLHGQLAPPADAAWALKRAGKARR